MRFNPDLAGRLLGEAQRLTAGLRDISFDGMAADSAGNFGRHRFRKGGSGQEFRQFRRYRPEDPARSIDWRKTAQGTQTLVREKEWERPQVLALLVDAAPGMDYHAAHLPYSKRQYAQILGLALATLAIQTGEAIALPPLPARRYDTPDRLAQPFLAHTAPASDTSLSLPHADSFFILFSDLLKDPAECDPLLRGTACSAREKILVCVRDPDEAELPFTGRILFEDMTGTDRCLVAKAESARADYGRLYREHQAATDALCRRYGWHCLVYETHRPALSVLRQLIRLMNRK